MEDDGERYAEIDRLTTEAELERARRAIQRLMPFVRAYIEVMNGDDEIPFLLIEAGDQ